MPVVKTQARKNLTSTVSCSLFVREKLPTGDHQDALIALVLCQCVKLFGLRPGLGSTYPWRGARSWCVHGVWAVSAQWQVVGTYPVQGYSPIPFSPCCPAVKWGICRHLCKNHRMPWVGRDLRDQLVPTPPPWAGTRSTKPACSKPHSTWPWTLTEMEHPQLLWAACSSASSTTQ